MVDFNWADWTIFVIVAVSCVFGLKRGLIKETLSIANWIVALVISFTFQAKLALLLEDMVSTASLRQVIAFACLFCATLLVGGLINYIIGAFIKATGLSTMDRMLGMLFGCARGFAVVMVILLLAPPIISIDQDQWWADSFLIPNFLEFEDWARFSTSEVKSWLAQTG